LFLEEADRRRFLGLVAELPERFGVEVHAFVLMDNHYHLLVRTREANLSQAVEVARDVHLNPVRIGGLGLSKRDQRRARVLGCADPGAELVRRRLERLGGYRWSSWRVYLGRESKPGWLETGVMGRGCGGRSRSERRAALKAYTEQPIRQGVLDSPWEGLVAGVVLGESGYARHLLLGRKVNEEDCDGSRGVPRSSTHQLGFGFVGP
jgi:hypothetical protein